MAEQNLPGEYENPYKFNAKELDSETELYYYGARYYNPRLSIWYGVDPLADAPHLISWSPYHYSYNNPVNYVDPDGRNPIRALIAAGRIAKKAYKIYKKTGQLTAKSLKKAGLDEVVDIAGDLYTIFSGDATVLDRLGSAADLIIGTDFNKKGQKQVLNAVEEVVDATKNRVYLRKGTKQEIKENAPKTPEGDFIDPNTGQVIPKEGPFDIGHKPGEEWYRRKKMHQEKGSSRREVRDAENNPSLYQIENPSSNRSRKFEKK